MTRGHRHSDGVCSPPMTSCPYMNKPMIKPYPPEVFGVQRIQITATTQWRISAPTGVPKCMSSFAKNL